MIHGQQQQRFFRRGRGDVPSFVDEGVEPVATGWPTNGVHINHGSVDPENGECLREEKVEHRFMVLFNRVFGSGEPVKGRDLHWRPSNYRFEAEKNASQDEKCQDTVRGLFEGAHRYRFPLDWSPAGFRPSGTHFVPRAWIEAADDPPTEDESEPIDKAENFVRKEAQIRSKDLTFCGIPLFDPDFVASTKWPVVDADSVEKIKSDHGTVSTAIDEDEFGFVEEFSHADSEYVLPTDFGEDDFLIPDPSMYFGELTAEQLEMVRFRFASKFSWPTPCTRDPNLRRAAYPDAVVLPPAIIYDDYLPKNGIYDDDCEELDEDGQERPGRKRPQSRVADRYEVLLGKLCQQLLSMKFLKDAVESVYARERWQKVVDGGAIPYKPRCFVNASHDLDGVDWGNYQAFVEGSNFNRNVVPVCDVSCGSIIDDLYSQYNPHREIFSRKVFICGITSKLDEVPTEEMVQTFSSYGAVHVEWPNKTDYPFYPPKGFAFLCYENEQSVQMLLSCCVEMNGNLIYSFPLQCSEKHPEVVPIQVRPWRLADADYIVSPQMFVDIRRIVFLGGVPRPIRALDLAHGLEVMFGPVIMCSIDVDVEDRYPKGAARVAFASRSSYMAALQKRFIVLGEGDSFRESMTEIKPYILDDQNCDECNRRSRQGRETIFFCSDLECLQYYCEICWMRVHSVERRAEHKPVTKNDGGIKISDKLFEAAEDYGADWEYAARSKDGVNWAEEEKGSSDSDGGQSDCEN